MAISETNTSYSVSSYAITAHLDADSRGGSRDGWTRSRDKRLDSIQLVDDAGEEGGHLPGQVLPAEHNRAVVRSVSIAIHVQCDNDVDDDSKKNLLPF